MPSERAAKWAQWAPYAVICGSLVVGISATIISTNVTHPLINSTSGYLLSAVGASVYSLTMLYTHGFMLLYPDEAVEHEIDPPTPGFGTGPRSGTPETAGEAKESGVVMMVLFSLTLLGGIVATGVLTLKLLS